MWYTWRTEVSGSFYIPTGGALVSAFPTQVGTGYPPSARRAWGPHFPCLGRNNVASFCQEERGSPSPAWASTGSPSSTRSGWGPISPTQVGTGCPTFARRGWGHHGHHSCGCGVRPSSRIDWSPHLPLRKAWVHYLHQEVLGLPIFHLCGLSVPSLCQER